MVGAGVPKPRFIVLEGGEGAGKTTQIAYLAEALSQAGYTHKVAREPGGTELGEILRPILKGYKYPHINEWHALCGYNFSRMAYIFEVVQPTLAAGNWVLADRFAFSTIVYQGYAGGLPAQVVQVVTAGVVGDYWPDLTLILDIPPEVGLERREADLGDGSRYEDKGLAFHTQVREGYLNLLKDYPANALKIDATQTPGQVHLAVLAAINGRFGLALKPVVAVAA